MWIPDLADAARMSVLLAPHAATLGLPGGLGACRLVDARLSNPHLPGTPRCHGWATYVLHAVDEPVGRSAAGRTWYLEAHPDGTGERAWAAHAATAGGSAARFLPDLDVVAWPFPADPALPLLGALLDPRTAVRHVPGVTPPVTAVEVVRYQPRTSAVLRMALADGTAVFAKLVDVAGADVAAMARTHEALWASAGNGGPLRVAEPLGADPSLGLLWTREVTGPRLLDRLHPASAPGVADRLAALTAALHATGVATGPPVDLVEIGREARKKVAKLAVAHPAAAERLAVLLDRLPVLGERPAAPVTVHGDLHVDQLVDTDAGPVLLDLDSVTAGPAELDLAELVVDLVQRDPDGDVVRGFVPHLLEAYARYAGPAGAPLDRDLLCALADAEYVNRLYRHLRRHLPGWPADLERELDRHPALAALLAP